jgi:hypothetical protein
MTHSTLPSLPLRAVENVLRQLLNDMRTVVEARCRHHGTGSGTSANSAAGLLPCIGIEIIASRTQTGPRRDDSVRRVFNEIAELVGYEPYNKLGFPLFKMLRNGLAHGFWPNEVELPDGVSCTFSMIFWADETARSICVDEVAGHAESNHLTRMSGGRDIIIQVSAQHWFRDIAAYIEEFLKRLQLDRDLQTLVEENEVRLVRNARTSLGKQITEDDAAALGMKWTDSAGDELGEILDGS